MNCSMKGSLCPNPAWPWRGAGLFPARLSAIICRIPPPSIARAAAKIKYGRGFRADAAALHAAALQRKRRSLAWRLCTTEFPPPDRSAGMVEEAGHRVLLRRAAPPSCSGSTARPCGPNGLSPETKTSLPRSPILNHPGLTGLMLIIAINILSVSINHGPSFQVPSQDLSQRSGGRTAQSR